jgi:hypothetical protein
MVVKKQQNSEAIFPETLSFIVQYAVAVQLFNGIVMALIPFLSIIFYIDRQ